MVSRYRSTVPCTPQNSVILELPSPNNPLGLCSMFQTGKMYEPAMKLCVDIESVQKHCRESYDTERLDPFSRQYRMTYKLLNTTTASLTCHEPNNHDTLVLMRPTAHRTVCVTHCLPAPRNQFCTNAGNSSMALIRPPCVHHNFKTSEKNE